MTEVADASGTAVIVGLDGSERSLRALHHAAGHVVVVR